MAIISVIDGKVVDSTRYEDILGGADSGGLFNDGASLWIEVLVFIQAGG